MSYLVLARKFRPQSFAAIRGQDYTTKAISNAIIRDRVPHAFLFCGPRGVGKTSTARVLAKALNCTGREIPNESALEKDPEIWKTLEPCGECANCKEITRSASLAVWEIDGASNNSVDNVRELIDSLRSSPPPGSKYKIYIIDEVHMLSTAAFNALLKSLEEPPPNTIFIFATTEPQKIPETVISRCQRHDFRRLGLDSIEDQLREIAEIEKVSVEDEVLTFIARKAQGGMRDAQSMLDRLLSFSFEKINLEEARKVFGVLDSAFFVDLSRAVLARDSFSAFTLLDRAFSESINLRYFVDDFLTHWRNLLIISVSLEKKENAKALRKMLELAEEEFSNYQELTSQATSFNMQRLFDLAQQTADSALKSAYPRYVFEAGLAKMSDLLELKPLVEILETLKGVKDSSALMPSRTAPLRHASAQLAPLASSSEDQKKKLIAKAEEQSSEPTTTTFVPSWEAFIRHVQSRSEVVLATFLKRVSAKTFSEGLLELSAGAFDLKSLREGSSKQSLLSCLHSYSGIANWNLNFIEQEESGESSVKFSGPSPDSLLAQERSQRQKRIAGVEEEARSQQATKAVLAVFEGAEIEKISVKNR